MSKFATFVKSAAHINAVYGKFGRPKPQSVETVLFYDENGLVSHISVGSFKCPICGESFHHGRCVSR